MSHRTTASPRSDRPSDAGGSGSRPHRLTAEHVPCSPSPALVGVERPRLGWSIPTGLGAVDAYQLVVATDPRSAADGVGDVWDTGRVADPAAISATYAGPAFESDRVYHWAVRLESGGRWTAFSAPEAFRTGLLRAADWTASWIGADVPTAHTGQDPNPEPLLRHTFTVRSALRSARLYVSAVGYVRLWLDGRRIGDHVLDPGFTNVDERVLYVAHDVNDLLASGRASVLAAALGRGFRGLTTASVWEWSEASWHGEPIMLAQLHLDYADGTSDVIGSDTSWRWTDGPTRFDSVYAGETYDARHEPAGWCRADFDDSGWSTVSHAADPPRGRLEAQTAEPIRMREQCVATDVRTLGDGATVIDFGRTLAGWATLRAAAPSGTQVEIRYGERLRADGGVDNANQLAADRSQTDLYTFAGTGTEEWTPSYSWKGFRYAEVRGVDDVDATTMTAWQVSSDVADASTFASDEPMYTWLEAAMRATVRNNLHSVPTDTPFFEKNGWTGDVHVALWALLYQFDLSRFFAKWLEDLRADQLPSGSFPVFVPGSPTFRAAAHLSPAWTGVYPSLLAAYHLAYDDIERLRSHWEPLRRYAEFVVGILDGDLPEDVHGDWLAPAPDGAAIPPENRRLVGTAYSYRSLRTAARLADLLGHTADAQRWRTVAAHTRERFDATFFDPSVGHYQADDVAGYRQTSNLLPAAFGLVDEERRPGVVDSVVADVVARGEHLDTGCLGTSVLLPVLTDDGHGELAHRLLLQRTYPSWGRWRDLGSDTLWEAWGDQSRSRGHFFFGSPVQWLYGYAAGIRPVAPGYRRLVVRPHPLGEVGQVSAELHTVRGPVRSSWSRVDGTLVLDVDVPGGAIADVSLPTADRGDVREAPDSVTSWSRTRGRITATVGSGAHRFVIATA